MTNFTNRPSTTLENHNPRAKYRDKFYNYLDKDCCYVKSIINDVTEGWVRDGIEGAKKAIRQHCGKPDLPALEYEVRAFEQKFMQDPFQ